MPAPPKETNAPVVVEVEIVVLDIIKPSVIVPPVNAGTVNNVVTLPQQGDSVLPRLISILPLIP